MKKILFLGDSITEGVGASSKEKAYPYVTSNILGVDFSNFGVSGTRFAEQFLTFDNRIDFDESFYSRALKMEKDADLVVVFGATNDYGHGDALIGDKNSTSLHTFYGATKNLFSYLTKKYGKEKILVILPLYRYNEEMIKTNFFHEADKEINLEGYRKIIIEIASNFGLPYVDFKKEMGNPANELDEGNFIDGLHPNDSGHQKLGELLANYIKKHYKV